uniref:Uncharacterized protein n=1 Tax=Poecilia reticulata TaxID=8081 RepID=A0A3P9NXE8_POERE
MEVPPEGEEDTAGPLGSSCLSLKSDRSKKDPPNFSNDPEPCGSKQCMTSHTDPFSSVGHSSCPQCGKRSRIIAGQQMGNQSSTLHSKTFL